MRIASKSTILTIIVLMIVGAAFIGIKSINNYQSDGKLGLPGLSESVVVLRDEKGMPYIYAQNEDDALMAQGFITAQDRLFSMELIRMLSSGRIAEVFGEAAKGSDIKMRTIGFRRNAKKHYAILNAKEKNRLQKYVAGVNAYLETRSSHRHLKLKLAGFKPEKWTPIDPLTIRYFMGWGSSANLGDEVVAQLLVEKLGMEKAREIFPLNINPDDPERPIAERSTESTVATGLNLAADKSLFTYFADRHLRIGSNNWAVNAKRSPGKKPIVANDPHLDARSIPGPFYPMGIITPQYRAIGANIPGISGMTIGRTDHIAIGVTNGYGDIQDLYIETIDPKNPDRYLEGKRSLPFEIVEETIKMKDKNAPDGFKTETVKIRSTKRGPVVSGILADFGGDKVITLRWSPYETMEPSLGGNTILKARTVHDVREGLRLQTAIMLNFVFADDQGNIAWQTSGRIPIRSQKDGLMPYVVKDGKDNWQGWIPWEEMPHAINPERGWVGTSNHTTVTADYPYYFTSHFAPSWRQRRLIELMDAPGVKTAADHWRYQHDVKNTLAVRIAPIMAKALVANRETRDLGGILLNWDHTDDPDLVGPTVFQSVMRHLAMLTFRDELGDDLSSTMLNTWYFWPERLVAMIEDGNSTWFDNIATTDQVETLTDLIRQAAVEAKTELSDLLGPDPEEWLWGEVHRMEFVSNLRRKGFGKGLLGGGSHPFAGSGETLHRGMYKFDQPYKAAVTACLRMVADLDDPEKVMAVMPGGASGRLLDPHRTDQIQAFVDGTPVYWWFSDKAITEHAASKLVLNP